jgi:hypothetical protein
MKTRTSAMYRRVLLEMNGMRIRESREKTWEARCSFIVGMEYLLVLPFIFGDELIQHHQHISKNGSKSVQQVSSVRFC